MKRLFVIIFGIFTAVFVLPKTADAAAVFYSVGQTASDLKTGTPTVTIASGAATFSAAQTGNIGVGDRVTYNDGTQRIAYIAAKTNADMAHWTLITATGGVPADVTNATVTSITREYTSLSAAEAGATDENHLSTSDLMAGNFQLNFPCYYDTGADTTSVTIDGYGTSANNNIRVYTPSNIATEANQSQRHSGKWDDTKYRREQISASNISNLVINDEHTIIDGIQIKLDGTGQYHWGFVAGASNVTIKNNIATHIGSSSSSAGFYISGGQNNVVMVNNIAYGFDGNGFYIISGGDIGSNKAYNNTAYECGRGFNTGYMDAVAKNNIAQNCTDGFLDSSFYPGSDYNISDQANDAPGANSKNSTTVKFVDKHNKDFHLAYDDTAAREAGADLSADVNLAFSTDIDGHTRPTLGAWDIGADEGAIRVFFSIGQNTNDHKTGSPTISVTGNTATFSAAQTAANMGVGDVITYNTTNKCYISSKVSQTVWICVTATGGTPPQAAAGTTVNSVAHVFTSLYNAIYVAAGLNSASYLNTFDLYGNNYAVHLPCYYDTGPETTSLGSGPNANYVTASTNYIKIYTPTSTVSEVNVSQRHSGTWNDSKYSLEIGNGSNQAIWAGYQHMIIDGIQIHRKDVSSGFWRGVYINTYSSISNSIIKASNISSSSIGTGILYGKHAYNNLVYGFNGVASSSGVYGVMYVYNNTVYDCDRGFQQANWTMTAKNNIAQNTTSAGFIGTFDASSTHNLSGDNTAPAYGAYYRGVSVEFADVVNEDFHLKATDSVARNAGVKLSTYADDANLNFTTDIDGQERSGTWSIGADEPGGAVVQQPQTVNQQATAGLDSGLVLYQSFDGEHMDWSNSSAEARDQSGKNNHGDVNGATAADGARGQGMSFDGEDDTVSTVKSALSTETISVLESTSDGSISFWIKSREDQSAAYGTLFNYKYVAGVENYIQLWNNWGNETISFCGKNNWQNNCIISEDTNITRDNWYHITITNTIVDASTSSVKIYIDGIEKGSGILDRTIFNNHANSVLYINKNSSTTSSASFNGSMDEIRMYSRALSADEVGQLYRLGGMQVNSSQNNKNTIGLVGHWSFNGPDVSGATANDVSGNNNHGTISGATPARGKIGQGFNFNGTGNYVEITDRPGIEISPSVTVSAWVNVDTYKNYGTVIGRWNETGNNRVYSLTLFNNGYVYWYISHNGGSLASEWDSINSGQAIGTNRWRHIIATFDGDWMRLYFDGQEVATKDTSLTTLNTNSTANLRIGSSQMFAAQAGAYFDGKIDEPRVYNRALSAEEIGNLYRLGQVEIRE